MRLIGGGLFSVMMFVITSSTARKAKKAQKTLFSVKSKLLNDQHVNYCWLRILKHITFPSHVPTDFPCMVMRALFAFS